LVWGRWNLVAAVAHVEIVVKEARLVGVGVGVSVVVQQAAAATYGKGFRKANG
jgi:hypothetical protein